MFETSALTMVPVRGGWFEMGNGNGFVFEKPLHKVRINDFYMGKYTVTRALFREFIEETGYQTDAEKGDGAFVVTTDYRLAQKSDACWLNPYFAQSHHHPVVCVSWNDAIAYCNWRSKKERRMPVYTIKRTAVSADFSANGYRLPTEAEWEYAARCGEKGYKFSWGDGAPNGLRGGNIADKMLKRAIPRWPWNVWEEYDDGHTHTAPVGSFEPNELGLYDMTGNVWEWCWDWYSAEYYKKSPKHNPLGPSRGDTRVIRGGSWFNELEFVRTTYRIHGTPNFSYFTIGFRLARSF